MAAIQRIRQILRSVNENAMHGHLTVDLLRKAFSSREQLMPGWKSLECEFAVPGLLEGLEAEIQNALLTTKNAIKVLSHPAPITFLSPDVGIADSQCVGARKYPFDRHSGGSQ
jgi:hypothetical protein